MPFEWFVALRFLKESRFQSLLILAGVAVGVGVMIFLSALIDGLQQNILEKTLSSQAHIVVHPSDEAPRVLLEALDSGASVVAARIQRTLQRTQSISRWQEALEQIGGLPEVIAAAPTVNGPAFVARGEGFESVALRGVEAGSYQRILPLRDKLVAGAFSLGGSEALIGVELADLLDLSVGDKLRLITGAKPAAVFTVSGIFDLGNKDLNKRWVFVSLRVAQNLLDLRGDVSTIELQVQEIFQADRIAERVAARTGLVADSWMRLNAQLLTALRSQSSSSLLIQVFVLVAVALGIASVLAVSVVQKSREIGILRAVGTSRRSISRIFLIQGGLVGLIGSFVGCLLGSGLATFFASLARNADGSPLFPILLTLGLYLRAAGIATFTGLASAFLPARRAARLDPAVVIRHG